MPLRLAKFAVGAALLTSLAYAQGSSEPASSAIVSDPASPAESAHAASIKADTSTEAPSPSIEVIPSDPADSTPPEGIEPDKSTTPDEAAIVADPASLLPDLPPVPRANATLVGGTLEHLDRVRDQVTVRVFGGGTVKALFDPRTHVYRGSKEVTVADLHEGERIYLDTILDGTSVFARSIRLNAPTAVGESQGVVTRYRADRGELTIRDGISPNPVDVRLSPSTKFMQGNREVSASTLVPGTLVSVDFSSQGNGRGVARQVSILALPGTRYIFSGQVVHIDLRRGLLVLNSSTDRKTYELYLEPSSTPDDNLHPGTIVTVVANYENSRYVVHNLTVNSQGR
jgi:Domain of unknown function (DUF5666)